MREIMYKTHYQALVLWPKANGGKCGAGWNLVWPRGTLHTSPVSDKLLAMVLWRVKPEGFFKKAASRQKT